MKIINLVENTKKNECLNEHGLSFYIETEKHKLLMDTGASDLFLQNAEILGVDLTQVDTVILSHGHYDHSGGLLAFAKIDPKAKIYLKDTADGDHYHLDPEEKRYIGIDPKIMKLPQVIAVSDDLKLDEELSLMTGFDGKRNPSWSNEKLKKKTGDVYVQDKFEHEQCLVLTQGERKILFSGCAHNGILSILDKYHKHFGEYPDTVISGFHMMKKTQYTPDEVEYIRHTAYELLKTKALFYTGHCTGQAAFEIMKEIMGDRLQELYSGMRVE